MRVTTAPRIVIVLLAVVGAVACATRTTADTESPFDIAAGRGGYELIFLAFFVGLILIGGGIGIAIGRSNGLSDGEGFLGGVVLAFGLAALACA